jgi:excisionase family DNA binding protein
MEPSMADNLPEGQMLFTLQEVSTYLKISISSLHRWRKDGLLSARKVGRHWRVPRDEVSRLASGADVSSIQPIDPLVMPDTEHGIRRPWLGIIESRDQVDFMRRKLVMMTLEEDEDLTLISLIQGFTTQELNAYHKALSRLASLADRVLREREVIEPHKGDLGE